MQRIVYKLRNQDGLFFAGNNAKKKFTPIGRDFYSLEELEKEIADKVCGRYLGAKGTAAHFLSGVTIVKEVHNIIEEPPERDIGPLSKRLLERERVLKRLHSYQRFRLQATWIQRDLQELFPTWDIDGFSHILMIMPDSSNDQQLFINPEYFIKQICKNAGLKRGDFKVNNRTIAVKSSAHASLVKVSFSGDLIYLDLNTI